MDISNYIAKQNGWWLEELTDAIINEEHCSIQTNAQQLNTNDSVLLSDWMDDVSDELDDRWRYYKRHTRNMPQFGYDWMRNKAEFKQTVAKLVAYGYLNL